MLFWKSKKTALLVAATLLLMGTMMWSQHSKADAYIGLGRSIFNSHLTVPELGYRFENYGVEISGVGEGWTKKGHQTREFSLSGYHIIDPNWCALSACFKAAIGVAYTPNQLLIDDFNYMLEFFIALPWGVELSIEHDSSAGLTERNTGLDRVGLRFEF